MKNKTELLEQINIHSANILLYMSLLQAAEKQINNQLTEKELNWLAKSLKMANLYLEDIENILGID
jgi:hypothetical protein